MDRLSWLGGGRGVWSLFQYCTVSNAGGTIDSVLANCRTPVNALTVVLRGQL